ncbi:MAG TPA: hypothetical protein ENJ43_08210 [Gammaproteobacteria bacterium]|nr:hypothetical protein [Gammaproteobacteria bacterium]
MAQNDGQERTEQATPKRLREAREKGQVARSRELTTMAMLLSSAGALLFTWFRWRPGRPTVRRGYPLNHHPT